MNKSNLHKPNTVPGAVRSPMVAALLLALPLFAYAAGPIPGAGTLLQQAQPQPPVVPSSNETGLSIQQSGSAALPASKPFSVKQIRIVGNTLFSTDELHNLVKDAEGKDLTLPQLDELAARISEYYHQHGYSLTRALIPAQTISGGVLEIQVLEARYGKISFNNNSKVVDGLLHDSLSALHSGDDVEQGRLDHDLLLLSDIPGVGTTAILKPGEEVGTSDLQIDARQEASVAGNLSADNYGNRTTGRERASGVLEIIDPAHHGDVLTFSGLTSGKDMNYGQLSYDTMLSGSGTHLGGSYSYLHYTLGSYLSNIDGHGTAAVGSLWLKQTLARGRNFNLYGQMQFDNKQLEDDIDASGIYNKRHLNNLTTSVTGDGRDAFLAGGVNAWSASITTGKLKFDNVAAQLSDASSAKTDGGFSKFNVQFTRLQQLNETNSLHLSLSAQLASNNLDSVEKMIAGGPTSVRAYDMSVLSGDIGYLGTVEFHHDLNTRQYGQFQAIAFVDSEYLQLNKAPWIADTNDATLTGAGFGLNWTGNAQWDMKAYVAKPVGALPSLLSEDGKRARFWIQLNKGF